jgi:acetyl esterase/lipase
MAYIADPELAAIVHMLPRADLSDLPGTREAARQMAGQAPVYQPGRELDITDVTVPGPPGDPGVPARVIVPAERTGLLPGLIYLHEGAFSFGSIASIEAAARYLADRVDVAVITVAYRLAPEHPYPAALHDSYAALEWATGARAADHGIDPGQVAVLGQSAGGGLAAALSMLARDRSGPRIVAQFLDAPTVDDRCAEPSMREFPDTPLCAGVNSPILWRYYLGDIRPGSDDVPLYAAPARAMPEDLAGLPPAWVATYQIDPTRDEVLNFAGRLIHAGVPTELHHYAGAFHLSHLFPGTSIGARMLADRAEAIGRILV